MSDPVYSNPLEEEAAPDDFVNLGSLADDMVYRLPGCSDLMIRKTLQQVYAEFCLQTWALRATTSITPVVAQREYRLVIPSQTYIFRVVAVKRNKSQLKEVRDYTALTGTPARIVLTRAPEVVSAGDEILVETVCVPTRGAEDVPTWFSTMYGAAIVSGSLFKLFAMSGKAWSDPAQAQVEAIAYQNAMSDASLKGIAGSQIHGAEHNVINYGGML